MYVVLLSPMRDGDGSTREEKSEREALSFSFFSDLSLQTTKLRSADFSKILAIAWSNHGQRAYAQIACVARKIGDLHLLEMRSFAPWIRMDTDRVFWMPFRCCWGGGRCDITCEVQDNGIAGLENLTNLIWWSHGRWVGIVAISWCCHGSSPSVGHPPTISRYQGLAEDWLPPQSLVVDSPGMLLA